MDKQKQNVATAETPLDGSLNRKILKKFKFSKIQFKNFYGLITKLKQ